MKLLKFFLKYYLFHKIQSKKNIENVIQSQGIKILYFDPLDPMDDVSLLMQNCNCWDSKKEKPGFLYISRHEKYLFIRSGHSRDEKIIILFHEEAHVWYNHPFRSGLIDDSDLMHEEVAHLFRFKLRLLKTFSTLALIIFLTAGVFFLASRPSNSVAEQDPVVDAAPQTEEPPAQSMDTVTVFPEDPVWITAEGDAYHRQFCGTITGSHTVTQIMRMDAEQLGRHPCAHCNP